MWSAGEAGSGCDGVRRKPSMCRHLCPFDLLRISRLPARAERCHLPCSRFAREARLEVKRAANEAAKAREAAAGMEKELELAVRQAAALQARTKVRRDRDAGREGREDRRWEAGGGVCACGTFAKARCARYALHAVMPAWLTSSVHVACHRHALCRPSCLRRRQRSAGAESCRGSWRGCSPP